MGVLTELADAISIEELEYSLLARNEDECDYNIQINKMKEKALAFQRERTKK